MFKNILLVLLVVMFSFSAMAEDKDDYSWCALKSNTVNVRTGPGKRYPIKWVYQRKNMPMKNIAEYDNWVKIEDYEGTTGWVHPSMVSERQTFIVTADYVYLNKNSKEDSSCIAKLEQGVVGDVVECEKDKCKVKAGNWAGYVANESIWGSKEQNAK
jgi:SH3-like domain-containing protein